MLSEKFKRFEELWQDAYSKRADIDNRILRRRELYKGTNKVRDLKSGGYSKKLAACYKNMCFELVETQIINAIPMPKVTPRDPKNTDLAMDVEGYLKSEMDRIQFETINDMAERETYIQGTCFYLVGWDSLANTPVTQGELTVRMYPLDQVYPQPGVINFEDLEYIFVKELVSVSKLKKLYKVDVEESANYKGLAEMITCYYYSDDGYVSRVAWVKDQEVFDQENFELRQFRICKECGEKVANEKICPVCGSKKFIFESVEDESLEEDIVVWDEETGEQQKLIAKKGDSIPYYKIKTLPFVIRRNVSDPKSLYGISDIDVLENCQESSNKLLTKMEQNVLKGGSIVTVPDKTTVKFDDEPLKQVPIKDPKMAQYFTVSQVQANIQQEDILQARMYENGRIALGITDSYQGKRDPTAESGKAKEISAAQAAGRLESKKRMKEASYGDLYSLMFKFLLAYCDEKRTYARLTPEGSYIEGKFNRYNFLDGELGDVYYNDRFLFSVDSASILSSDRQALWQETNVNFQSGTFGNPADPTTLMLYWNIMKGLGYPLAKMALSSLQERTQQLPFELQQAIMNNPEILSQATALASGQAEIQPKIKEN